jgi:hypothetical protein
LRPDSIQRAGVKYILYRMRCMKGKWGVDTPIFEKKHFWQQSNDIPKHIEKVAGEGDFESSY